MDPDANPGLALWHRRQRIIRYSALIISIIVSSTANILQSLYVREPYHTSALSGEAWVLELLCGHPNRICMELGISVEVFSNHVQELRDIGYQNSRNVSLEEQLAIFLYMCVTGLTIRHVGERFQRSNETISRRAKFSCSQDYFNGILMVDIFKKSYPFSPLLPSTQSMYNYQRLAIRFPIASGAIPNFGHILRMH
jgi:hypothetical protein